MAKKTIILFVEQLYTSGGKTAMAFQMAEFFVAAGYDVTICAFWQPLPHWLMRLKMIIPIPTGVKLAHIFSLKDREFKKFSVYHAKKKNSQQRLDAFCAYCEGIGSDAIYLPNYGDDIQAMVQKHVPKRVFKILGDHNGTRYSYLDALDETSAMLPKHQKFYAIAKKFDALHVVNPLVTRHVTDHVKTVIKIPNFIRNQPAPTMRFIKSQTIVACGRLVEPKNFADLIKAFQISVNAHPEWSLEIYRRGPQHSELKKLIAELAVGRSVSILKPSSNFREHLLNAAMHVSSSKFESFGLTLAEAMSYGVPVVSQYNHLGAKFLLDDGREQLADLPNVQSVADLISKNMGMIEKGDPDNVLRRQVEKAYLFSKTISEENALGLWKDTLDQGIQQKLLAE